MGELLVRGADTEAISSVTLRRADQVIPVRRLLFANGSRTSPPPAGPARPGGPGWAGASKRLHHAASSDTWSTG